MSIAKYHGEISKCTCGIADNPEKVGERACKLCFSRGFVAACRECDGKGQVEAKMAGGPGLMKSTCIPCGGSGLFAVPKPADWTDGVKCPNCGIGIDDNDDGDCAACARKLEAATA